MRISYLTMMEKFVSKIIKIAIIIQSEIPIKYQELSEEFSKSKFKQQKITGSKLKLGYNPKQDELKERMENDWPTFRGKVYAISINKNTIVLTYEQEQKESRTLQLQTLIEESERIFVLINKCAKQIHCTFYCVSSISKEAVTDISKTTLLDKEFSLKDLDNMIIEKTQSSISIKSKDANNLLTGLVKLADRSIVTIKGRGFRKIHVEKTNEDFKMSYTYDAEDTNTLLNFIEKIDMYSVGILKKYGD